MRGGTPIESDDCKLIAGRTIARDRDMFHGIGGKRRRAFIFDIVFVRQERLIGATAQQQRATEEGKNDGEFHKLSPIAPGASASSWQIHRGPGYRPWSASTLADSRWVGWHKPRGETGWRIQARVSSDLHLTQVRPGRYQESTSSIPGQGPGNGRGFCKLHFQQVNQVQSGST